MKLNVRNETSTLKAVVLGQPGTLNTVPDIHQIFDAKSYETVLNCVYPNEEDVCEEISLFRKILLKYGVQVFHPTPLENCNQVFARDVAFVIDDKIVYSNIIPDRTREREAFEAIFNRISCGSTYFLPDKVHVEGGDIILYNDIVFMGLYSGLDYPKLKTARTNLYACHFLRELFPEKCIIPLELKKHDTDPLQCILHLDCTFMPVGRNKAIIFKDGFCYEKDYQLLVEIFGEDNLFKITREEMYYMNANVFSISPEVVVSEKQFVRLNKHLTEQWNMTVETVPYFEISKMGGLLHCSTMPLIRDND